MLNSILSTQDDIQWLRDTALRGVPLPTKYADFRFAILQGNGDAPYAVNLYTSEEPIYTDDYYRVTFDHSAPIYCEGLEYRGETDSPTGLRTIREVQE